MAKKKQFAGKKTKLAKLPLTQALVNLAAGEAPFAADPWPAPSLGPPRPIPGDEINTRRKELLAAAFLFVVHELDELMTQLHANPESSRVSHRSGPPERLPRNSLMLHSLREAQQSLRDLRGLLSHP
jgi:hypothetical protein